VVPSAPSRGENLSDILANGAGRYLSIAHNSRNVNLNGVRLQSLGCDFRVSEFPVEQQVAGAAIARPDRLNQRGSGSGSRQLARQETKYGGTRRVVALQKYPGSSNPAVVIYVPQVGGLGELLHEEFRSQLRRGLFRERFFF